MSPYVYSPFSTNSFIIWSSEYNNSKWHKYFHQIAVELPLCTNDVKHMCGFLQSPLYYTYKV